MIENKAIIIVLYRNKSFIISSNVMTIVYICSFQKTYNVKILIISLLPKKADIATGYVSK